MLKEVTSATKSRKHKKIVPSDGWFCRPTVNKKIFNPSDRKNSGRAGAIYPKFQVTPRPISGSG